MINNIIISIIIALTFIPLSGTHAEDTDSVIPFRLDGHMILVDVKINDHNEVLSFVFDTGSRTFMNYDAFKELELKAETTHKSPLFPIAFYYCTLDSIRIGGISKSGFKIESRDVGNLLGDYEFAGFIGCDFFGKSIITIDYKNKRLIISSGDKPFPDEDITISTDMFISPMGGIPIIECRLKDSIDVAIGIDTGAPSALILPTDYMNTLNFLVEKHFIKMKGEYLKWSFAEQHDCFLSSINSMKIGNTVLQNQPVIFYDKLAVFGRDFLSNFLVSLDFINNRLYLTPVKNKTVSSEFYSFGFIPRRHKSGEISIKGIWENSPADSAGLNLGDEILSINGIASEEITRNQMHDLLFRTDSKSISLSVSRNGSVENISLKRQNLLKLDD